MDIKNKNCERDKKKKEKAIIIICKSNFYAFLIN